MKLFDETARDFVGPARRSETTFNYLNRSARPDVVATREAVEEMFAVFPESSKTDLRARFRSSNEAHSGAFFELFLFTLIGKLGYDVTLHPSSDSAHNRRVDFQVGSKGKNFFIEARALTTSGESDHRDHLLAPVLDAVDGIDSPDFFLHVEIDGSLQRAIAIKPIKSHLDAWLKSLDYDQIKAATVGGATRDNLPMTTWQQDGCKLEFTAFPKHDARGKPGRAIGMQFGGVFMCDTGQRLRKMLSTKARRYGKLNAPYVIAVNVLDGFADEEDVLEALYGQEAVQFSSSTGRRVSRPFRMANGLWRQHSGPRYTRVSAVLIASHLWPWSMPQARLTLYLNPWAEFPLSEELSTLEAVRLGADGTLSRTNGNGVPQITLGQQAEGGRAHG